MGAKELEFRNPEDRLFLTVDFENDFLRMQHLMKNLGHRVHAVKLGQGFLLYDRWPQLLRWLHAGTGITTYLDLKSHEDPDQMARNTTRVAKLGFEYMSVHASAKEENLMAAAKTAATAGHLAVVAALSYSSRGVIEKELQHIKNVNDELPIHERICAIMCNARQLEHTAVLDGVLRIATGLRMPGDDNHDQPEIATPAEAIAAGADILAVGRAITAATRPEESFEAILENMATAL
jgi:orotidine-5'-phosphate decarboxylase